MKYIITNTISQSPTLYLVFIIDYSKSSDSKFFLQKSWIYEYCIGFLPFNQHFLSCLNVSTTYKLSGIFIRRQVIKHKYVTFIQIQLLIPESKFVSSCSTQARIIVILLPMIVFIKNLVSESFYLKLK